MSQALLHFIEHDAGDGMIDPEHARVVLRTVGLDDQYPQSVPLTCTIGKGPDGRVGVLVADSRSLTGPLVYEPDRQTWLPRHTEPASFCGVGSQRPTPESLARERQLDGHYCTMGDGQDWLAPRARMYSHVEGQIGCQTALPVRAALDEAGNFTPGEIVPRHRALWDDASRWFDVFAAANGDGGNGEPTKQAIDFADAHEICARAIGTNYRIGKHEAVLLELFDDNTVRDVLDALIDWPTVMQLQKKTDEPVATS